LLVEVEPVELEGKAVNLLMAFAVAGAMVRELQVTLSLAEVEIALGELLVVKAEVGTGLVVLTRKEC
jgi:hypothetical protein